MKNKRKVKGIIIIIGMNLSLLVFGGATPISLTKDHDPLSPRFSSILDDITIHSPESITYEGGMNGYYPATHGFEDIDNLEQPDNWYFDGSGGSALIVDNAYGHNKVLELSAPGILSWIKAGYTFVETQTNGIIEFWVCVVSSSSIGSQFIRIYDNNEGEILIRFKPDLGEISYYDGDEYNYIRDYSAGTWYHFHIEFSCDTDVWILVINQKEYYWIDYLGEMPSLQGYEYNGDPKEMEGIEFDSFNGYFYIDAVGHSWDESYNIWDNYNEGIFIDFSCQTPLFCMDYSLDNNPRVEITPKYSIVIPMTIGGGQHTIQIKGVSRSEYHSQFHESPIRYFTIEEILGWGVDAINAEKVWGGSEDAKDILLGNPTGEDVKVLVIDTGIDLDHEDLIVNLDPENYGWDFFENDSSPDDEFGHGTHCAGIIGAAYNDLGILGVAPNVDLYAARVGTGMSFDITLAEKAIQWGINNDIDVISMSFTTGGDWLLDDCKQAYQAGIVLVAATGNDFLTKIRKPARYSSVIAVGAVREKEGGGYIRQEFSNYGERMELVAPGVNIFSTMIDGKYAYKSGTSMACPMVAGVCALLISSDPSLKRSPSRVREILNNSAIDLGDPDWDEEYGWGMVNAFHACDYSPPEVEIISHDMGDWVKGSVTITASATDAILVKKVAFKIDEGLWYEDTDGSDGWSYDWDTTGYTTRYHSIWCRAYDTKGNYDEDVVSVGVDNIPPTVDIISPSHYKTVKRIITITASASDNTNLIKKVQFFIDSALKYEDTNGADGWAWNWDTLTSSEDEYHYVKCRAFDRVDNHADHQHTVFVHNFPTDPGPGCPILSVFDGTGYIVEGLLDIHDPEGIDVLTTHTLITTPEPVSHHYLLKLTEHPVTISHIDQVKLYGRMANGNLIPLQLTSAIHSSLGEVRSELWFSDDKRVDLYGAEHNGGLSEFITLEFMAPAHNNFIEFIFVIEGNNPIIK